MNARYPQAANQTAHLIGRDTLITPFGPSRNRKGDRMAFAYRLELKDGTPADPPTFRTAVPNWRVGDVIPLGHSSLRVVEVRDDDADQAPTLVVEEVA
jgi:hypothetical protein